MADKYTEAKLQAALEALTDSRGDLATKSAMGSGGISYGTDQGLSIILALVGPQVSQQITNKLNELIDAYNQLKLDHNNAIIPTSAATVARLED